MSFKRSVFFSLGRPSPKPVPLDVIARIGHTHITPEPVKEVATPVVEPQINTEKLTQAITDAIDKAIKQNKPMTNPEGDPTDPTVDGPTDPNQNNAQTASANNNAGLEKLIVNNDDDKNDPSLDPDDIWDPPLDPSNLNDKDPVLYKFIRERKPVIRIVGVDNNKGEEKLPIPVIIVNSRFTDDEIRYTRYTKTNRPNGREKIHPERFKSEILEYNKAYLEGSLNTNKSITGFITEHSK